MVLNNILDYVETFEETEQCFPFDENTLVVKTNTKMFLLISVDENPLRINVKCDPEEAIELREQFSSIIPGYHMNKKLWNTIILDGTVPVIIVKECIKKSYYLINAKKSSKKSRI